MFQESENFTNDDCFSIYDKSFFVNVAVNNNLISEEKDILNLKIGHFRGIDAVKCFIRCKLNKPFQGISKNLKQITIPFIINKLKTGEYDGKSISEIISSEKKNLAESLTIYDDILTCGCEIFSFDKKYSLPHYKKTGIILTHEEKEIFLHLWRENKNDLRSWEDFNNLFKNSVENFDSTKTDPIIEFLVNNHIKCK